MRFFYSCNFLKKKRKQLIRWYNKVCKWWDENKERNAWDKTTDETTLKRKKKTTDESFNRKEKTNETIFKRKKTVDGRKEKSWWDYIWKKEKTDETLFKRKNTADERRLAKLMPEKIDLGAVSREDQYEQ